ncbi:MAG: hypothetical protein AB1403_10905 [Candidatus Riflebacteria bacterium]
MKKAKLVSMVSNGNRIARVFKASQGEHLVFKKTINNGELTGVTIYSRFSVNYCGEDSAIKEAEEFIKEATK